MSFKTPRFAAAALAAAALLVAPAASAYAWGPDGDDTAVPLDVDGRTYVAGDGPTVLRIAGEDRIATAIKAFCATESWRNHHSGDNSDRLILADSLNYADALASGPLADLLDAPILVTPSGDKLDPRIVSLLVLGCDGVRHTRDDAPIDSVTITSGTGVLKEGIVQQLLAPPVFVSGVLDTTKGAGIPSCDSGRDLRDSRRECGVDRYAGLNRYQTATAIAKYVDYVAYHKGYDNLNVFLADGDNFPDALAAGAAAAERNGVVILTMGAAGLDNTGFEFASNYAYSGKMIQNHNEVWVVGGNAAKAAVKGFNGVRVEPAFSVVGSDRYATAAMLAEQAFTLKAHGQDFVVASGEVPADAVFGGGFAANLDGPLLLTASSTLSTPTGDYLKEYATADARITVFGGTGSVSPTVSGQLVALLAAL
jgi:putative cell wall-binding protein